MKEASGEFSMTVVTIVAVTVVAGVIAFMAPKVAGWIEGEWSTVSTQEQTCAAGQVWNGNKCVPKE